MKFFKKKSKRKIMLEQLKTEKEILERVINTELDFIILDLTKEVETLNKQIAMLLKNMGGKNDNRTITSESYRIRK